MLGTVRKERKEDSSFCEQKEAKNFVRWAVALKVKSGVVARRFYGFAVL
jgi:hypothetical protein